MLGCLSIVVVIATAIGAGLGYYSFWWILIPAFIAGSFSLSNGPAYGTVIRANQEGRLGYFPMMLTIHFAVQLALGGFVYWITLQFS